MGFHQIIEMAQGLDITRQSHWLHIQQDIHMFANYLLFTAKSFLEDSNSFMVIGCSQGEPRDSFTGAALKQGSQVVELVDFCQVRVVMDHGFKRVPKAWPLSYVTVERVKSQFRQFRTFPAST